MNRIHRGNPLSFQEHSGFSKSTTKNSSSQIGVILHIFFPRPSPLATNNWMVIQQADTPESRRSYCASDTSMIANDPFPGLDSSAFVWYLLEYMYFHGGVLFFLSFSFSVVVNHVYNRRGSPRSSRLHTQSMIKSYSQRARCSVGIPPHS